MFLSKNYFTCYRTIRIWIVDYVMQDYRFFIDVPAIHTATIKRIRETWYQFTAQLYIIIWLVLLLHERWNHIQALWSCIERSQYRLNMALRIILHRHQAWERTSKSSEQNKTSKLREKRQETSIVPANWIC